MPALAPTATTVTATTVTATPAADRGTAATRARAALGRRLSAVPDREAGMATAEYAVATVAACGFGGVLYKVITNDSVLGAISKLIGKALSLAF